MYTFVQLLPCIVTGRGRTLARPIASFFLNWLKLPCSAISSELNWWQNRLSVSWGGNCHKSCLILYCSPILLMYGTLPSGRQLKYWCTCNNHSIYVILERNTSKGCNKNMSKTSIQSRTEGSLGPCEMYTITLLSLAQACHCSSSMCAIFDKTPEDTVVC